MSVVVLSLRLVRHKRHSRLLPLDLVVGLPSAQLPKEKQRVQEELHVSILVLFLLLVRHRRHNHLLLLDLVVGLSSTQLPMEKQKVQEELP